MVYSIANYIAEFWLLSTHNFKCTIQLFPLRQKKNTTTKNSYNKVGVSVRASVHLSLYCRGRACPPPPPPGKFMHPHVSLIMMSSLYKSFDNLLKLNFVIQNIDTGSCLPCIGVCKPICVLLCSPLMARPVFISNEPHSV